MSTFKTPVVAAALACGLLAAAAPAAVQPPATIAKSGKIVFCSDMTYPPEESVKGGKPVGSDIDIAKAVARQFGVEAQFKQVGFDALIAALRAKRCNSIISGMTDNAQRRKQVDFADYMKLGSSLMVKKGNPRHITALESLSGHSVAVQTGTTERDIVTALNAQLGKKGRKPVTIEVYPTDAKAASALADGKADAYLSDDLGVLFRVQHSKGRFIVAASGIAAAPIGIATRKADSLGAATRRAIAGLYANGTMKSILAKWGLSAFALQRRTR